MARRGRLLYSACTAISRPGTATGRSPGLPQGPGRPNTGFCRCGAPAFGFAGRTVRTATIRVVLALALAAGLVPGPAFAQGRKKVVVQEPNVSVRLGARTWLSNGRSDITHFQTGAFESILEWSSVKSEIYELTADALFFRRFILDASAGSGAFHDGKFVDQDRFAPPLDGPDIESVSEVQDDGMEFFAGHFGVHVLDWDTGPESKSSHPLFIRLKGSLDLLIGYHYWREKYVATKGTQTVPPLGPFSNQGKGITEEMTWKTWAPGVNLGLEFDPKFRLDLRALVVGRTDYRFIDIHHLRTDFRKNPSAKAKTKGGEGQLFDVAFSWNPWKDLTVELGYRRWDLTSDDGTDTTFLATGEAVVSSFGEAHNTRDGLILGIHYRF